MTYPSDDADAGRGSLRDRLPRVMPSPELETRVRSSLESRRLLQGPSDRRGGPTRVIVWVGRAGLLAAGLVLGMLLSNRRPDTGREGQYVLLLYGDPPNDTGAVHAAREREYGRWAAGLTGARWVGGHELAGVVDRLGPSAVGDAASADRLAGYFEIEAPSRERAAEVARTCPHLKYGGRVVVMAVAG